jgi:23S rRNA A1618 N6-methylase RlmF
LIALARLFPELRKFFRFSRQIAMQRRADRFMWEEPDAVRHLTAAMLQHYFRLAVDIPPAHLMPHLTLRLNYVHFLEDLLLADANWSADHAWFDAPRDRLSLVHGIDIGAGATCIFPLLLARLHPAMRLLATEINAESFRIAARNWHANFDAEHPLAPPDDAARATYVAPRFELRLADGASILLSAVRENERAQFCMCNPPFFESVDAKQARGKRSFRAVASEVATEGGELAFVMQLIDESLQLRRRVHTYTTMLGRQSTLAPVLKRLRECGDVSECGSHELWQGRMCRSVVWWRVNDNNER